MCADVSRHLYLDVHTPYETDHNLRTSPTITLQLFKNKTMTQSIYIYIFQVIQNDLFIPSWRSLTTFERVTFSPFQKKVTSRITRLIHYLQGLIHPWCFFFWCFPSRVLKNPYKSTKLRFNLFCFLAFQLRKKPSYFPLYWLVYRDPYIGLLKSPYKWVV